MFRDLDGFDERYFMYREEVDLQKRVQVRGWPSVLIEDPLLTHFAGQSSSHMARGEVQLRSRLLFAETWYRPRGRRRVVLALHLVVCVDLALDPIRLVMGSGEHPIGGARTRFATIRRARRRPRSLPKKRVEAA